MNAAEIRAAILARAAAREAEQAPIREERRKLAQKQEAARVRMAYWKNLRRIAVDSSAARPMKHG